MKSSVSAPALARQREPLGHRVDRDDALGAEQEGAADRELADRTAAPDRDRLAAFDVAELGAHVAGREDVGEEQHLLVVEPVRHLDRPDIGVGHAQILRLAAGIAAEQMRVAEQAGRRVAPQLGRLLVIGIGALAAGEVAALAEEAFAAGDGERHDDPVADLELLVLRADLDDLAHGLVAEDVAALHLRDDAVEDVQVGAADGAGRHLDDGVARMLDFGIRHALAAHVALAVPDQSFHALTPGNVLERRARRALFVPKEAAIRLGDSVRWEAMRWPYLTPSHGTARPDVDGTCGGLPQLSAHEKKSSRGCTSKN